MGSQSRSQLSYFHSLTHPPTVGFPDGASGIELPDIAGDIRDAGLIRGLGRSPREGHSNPFQYSCLENPMDGGACQATVHGVTKSQTRD